MIKSHIGQQNHHANLELSFLLLKVFEKGMIIKKNKKFEIFDSAKFARQTGIDMIYCLHGMYKMQIRKSSKKWTQGRR
ncbi:MAG: hypothetical protein LBP62_00685 [Clostridiales bacterium]|nr:hypothetical protein [Clostridiales bacterium]